MYQVETFPDLTQAFHHIGGCFGGVAGCAAGGGGDNMVEDISP